MIDFCRSILSYLSLALLLNTVIPSESVSAQHNTVATTNVVRVPAEVFEDKELYYYFVEALKLALAKTNENENATVIQTDLSNANQDRLLRQVKEGNTDVTWAVASAEREQENLAVYFPLTRGLLGYRVFIVPPDSIQQFTNIDLNGLKQLVAVQGIGWPDTDALRFNGLSVEEVPFSLTFRTIDSGLADYYPRSVIEVEGEISNRPELKLALEKTVALYYPSPVYFFVKKSNPQLADRIKRGLDLAFQDGSLNNLFDARNFTAAAIKLLEGRQVIHLENPTLTAASKRTLKTYQSQLIYQNNQ